MHIIHADYIITCDENFAVLRDKAVVFDERIRAITDPARARAIAPAATVTRANVLTPALINAHTHLEFCANAGEFAWGDFTAWLASIVRGGRALAAGERAAATRRGLGEMLESGVGTFGEISSFGGELAACKNSGARVVFFVEILGSNPASKSQNLAHFRDRLDAAFAAAGGLFTPAVSVHSPYSTQPALAAAALDAARAENLIVSAHFLESAGELEWLSCCGGEEFGAEFGGDFGADGVANSNLDKNRARGGDFSADCGGENRVKNARGADFGGDFAQSLGSAGRAFAAHLRTLNPAAAPFYTPRSFLRLFGEAHTLLTHCCYGDVAFGERFFADLPRNFFITHCPRSNRLLGSRRLDFSRATTANPNGANIATDGISSNFSLNIFDELRAALMAHFDEDLGALARDVFRGVTANAARALRLENGVIGVGRLADFAIFGEVARGADGGDFGAKNGGDCGENGAGVSPNSNLDGADGGDGGDFSSNSNLGECNNGLSCAKNRAHNDGLGWRDTRAFAKSSAANSNLGEIGGSDPAKTDTPAPATFNDFNAANADQLVLNLILQTRRATALFVNGTQIRI